MSHKDGAIEMVQSDGKSHEAVKLRIVRCPHCGGDSIYAPSNSARPFCSTRCKNMDFGAWASEDFRVPAQPSIADLDTSDNTLQ